MNERESVMARIREALRVRAAGPGSHDQGGAPKPNASGQPQRDFVPLLPKVGHTFEAMAEAFAAASKELRTDFHVVELEAGAHLLLGALRDAERWQRVAAHRGELAAPIAESLGLPVLWTDHGYDKHQLEACDVGITACDALVAQTGTVLLTSASAGGRALSVLPPHHVVLARRAQLLPDLPSAFARIQEKYGTDYPSMISLITGPSRTGDIERILVLGAHGPKRLTVICW